MADYTSIEFHISEIKDPLVIRKIYETFYRSSEISPEGLRCAHVLFTAISSDGEVQALLTPGLWLQTEEQWKERGFDLAVGTSGPISDAPEFITEEYVSGENGFNFGEGFNPEFDVEYKLS